ncbi:MAG TPA: hypothetical protein VF450_20345 [Noviherbaspirillum sp.]
MFTQFPKTRPPLPREIEEIYSTHYKSNRDGDTAAASMAQRLEAWMHRKVAADVAGLAGTKRSTLEVGAGTLNQLQYEPEAGPYDIVEPFTSLYQGSKHLPRIRNIYGDITQVPDGVTYDRITSVATFEHILNLPELVARCGLLLADGGSLRTAIPSEGTFLWTLGWKLTTGLEFRMKYGLDYGLLMKHEHVNTAREIRDVLKFFFSEVKGSAFGLSNALSLYQFYECKRPRLERCREYALPNAA